MLQFSRRGTLPLLAILTFSCFVWQSVRAADSDSPAKKHGPIAWTASLDTARKTAGKEKKVVMVDFFAEWCGPCQEMLKTTYQDKRVVALSKKLVPVLIDVDSQPKLAEKYGVEAIPTLVFLDAKGNVLRKETGYHDTADFLQMAGEILSKAPGGKKR